MSNLERFKRKTNYYDILKQMEDLENNPPTKEELALLEEKESKEIHTNWLLGTASGILSAAMVLGYNFASAEYRLDLLMVGLLLLVQCIYFCCTLEIKLNDIHNRNYYYMLRSGLNVRHKH